MQTVELEALNEHLQQAGCDSQLVNRRAHTSRTLSVTGESSGGLPINQIERLHTNCIHLPIKN